MIEGSPATGQGKRKRVRRSLGPYKFDAKAARELIQSIKLGCWLEVASACAGISRKTVYNWLRRGKANETPELAKFFANYKRARHLSGRLHIQWMFAAASKGNTDASKWFLERRYPKHFGRRDKVVHVGEEGSTPIAIESIRRTTGERRAQLAALTAKAKERAAALELLRGSAEEEAADDGASESPESDENV